MNALPRPQTAALAAAALLVAAFIASFVLGLREGGGRGARRAAADSIVVPEPPTGRRVRVEVLNAAGRAGIARAATRRLRQRGFDVVYFGNADEFGKDSSVVLDRVGDPEAARDVADALGIGRSRSEPDGGLLLEVTVVLGTDWTPADADPSSGLIGRIRRLLRRARPGSTR